MCQRISHKKITQDQTLQAEINRIMGFNQQTLLQSKSMHPNQEKMRTSIDQKAQAHICNQKQITFRQQTLQFFKNNYRINLEGYFCPKYYLPKSQNLKFQQQSIIIYGVDYLSPMRLYNYFRHFLPNNIQWINDSTCKISFQFSIGAKRAILQNLVPGYGSIYKIKKGVWYSLKPYYVLGFSRNLEARISTNLDITVPILQDSQFSKYQEGRRVYLEMIQKQRIKQYQMDLLLKKHAHSVSASIQGPSSASFESDSSPTKPCLQQLLDYSKMNQQQQEPFAINITNINQGIDTTPLKQSSPLGSQQGDQQSLVQYLHSLKISPSTPYTFNS